MPLAVNKFLFATLPLRSGRRSRAGEPDLRLPQRDGGADVVAGADRQEFIEYAKANPGKATYASSGHGTSVHLSGELFNKMTGLKLQHIPYRGAGPALNDLIPGRVDVMFNNIGAVMPLIQGGKLRALGVTSSKRARGAAGRADRVGGRRSGLRRLGWYALFVPAKTPDPVIRKLHADTVEALADPATRARLEQLGVGVIGSSPEELRTHLAAEMASGASSSRRPGSRSNRARPRRRENRPKRLIRLGFSGLLDRRKLSPYKPPPTPQMPR